MTHGGMEQAPLDVPRRLNASIVGGRLDRLRYLATIVDHCQHTRVNFVNSTSVRTGQGRRGDFPSCIATYLGEELKQHDPGRFPVPSAFHSAVHHVQDEVHGRRKRGDRQDSVLYTSAWNRASKAGVETVTISDTTGNRGTGAQ